MLSCCESQIVLWLSLCYHQYRQVTWMAGWHQQDVALTRCAMRWQKLGASIRPHNLTALHSCWETASEHIQWEVLTVPGKCLLTIFAVGIDISQDPAIVSRTIFWWIIKHELLWTQVDKTRLETKNSLFFLGSVSWWARMCNSYTEKECTEGRISNVASFVRS